MSYTRFQFTCTKNTIAETSNHKFYLPNNLIYSLSSCIKSRHPAGENIDDDKTDKDASAFHKRDPAKLKAYELYNNCQTCSKY